MPRDFSYLSDETKLVLTDNTKALSREWYKTERYINQILSEERGDPFAPFVQMYDAAVRGNLPVCYWLNRLEASRLRYAPLIGHREPIECLEEKIDAFGDLIKDFSRFLADGKLDMNEIRRLETRIHDLKQVIKKTEVSLNFERGKLETVSNGNGRLQRAK